MKINEIKNFSRKDVERIKDKYKSHTDQELALAAVVKIMEELGELSENVLHHGGWQREDKEFKGSKEHLEEELADVLLTLFDLAYHLDLDWEKAIEKKMNILDKRWEK